MQLQENDEIIISIQDIGVHGEGIGDHEGFTIFVEDALIDEKVLVRIKKIKKSYAVAMLMEILTPSPDRIQAPCPYFSTCGGCQIQHLNYQKQLKIKQKRVQDTISRIGKLPYEVMPCISSENEFAYRNKIQFPINHDRSLGLYKRNSHQIVPIDQCLLHLPLGEAIFDYIQLKLQQIDIKPYDESTYRGELRHVLIRSTRFTGEALVGFVSTCPPSKELIQFAEEIFDAFQEVKGVVHILNDLETNRVLTPKIEILCGDNEIHEKLDDLIFYYCIESFFQVNPPQALKIYQSAIKLAQISDNDIVLDAFCGVGTLSLFFARHAKQVYGIESVPKAVQNAKKNAKVNQINNAKFYTGTVEEHIHKFKDIDWVILNPPRKGCSESTLMGALNLSPKGIIYISCDPATLARDLKIINEKGYQVEMIEPFDMFPQTMHVETLCIATKVS